MSVCVDKSGILCSRSGQLTCFTMNVSRLLTVLFLAVVLVLCLCRLTRQRPVQSPKENSDSGVIENMLKNRKNMKIMKNIIKIMKNILFSVLCDLQ